MNYQVHSRESVQGYECDEPHLVISVASPGTEHPALPENPGRVGVLRLFFHDVDGPDDLCAKMLRKYGMREVTFGEEEAGLVADFLAANEFLSRDAGTVIVHCEAGVSRSPAMAAAIAKVVDGDDEAFFKRYCPNMRVYRVLLNKLLDHANKAGRCAS